MENSRAYWQHWSASAPVSPQQAFDEYWFGAKSLQRVKILLASFRRRFDAARGSLAVLRQWSDASPETRKLICHWHLQFSDPLYRRFAGDYLVKRRHGARAEITRDLVTEWVGEQERERWSLSTRIELAGKLMCCAFAAGLLGRNRDPRPIALPRVRDEALAYLMYLLRGIDLNGTLLENPYLASVGLEGRILEDRLRSAPGLKLRRQGDLFDFDWQYPGLREWGDALLGTSKDVMEGKA